MKVKHKGQVSSIIYPCFRRTHRIKCNLFTVLHDHVLCVSPSLTSTFFMVKYYILLLYDFITFMTFYISILLEFVSDLLDMEKPSFFIMFYIWITVTFCFSVITEDGERVDPEEEGTF